MHPAEIQEELDHCTVLIDTREQMTDKLSKRIEQFNCEISRVTLSYGDYSIKCGSVDLRNRVVIERKMNLDELAMCFGSQRKRFEREFKRAAADNCKVYLLVENASFDILYSDEAYKIHCHSKFSRQAMISSIIAWSARYNLVPVFVNKTNSGYLIKEILIRELKEALNGMD